MFHLNKQNKDKTASQDFIAFFCNPTTPTQQHIIRISEVKWNNAQNVKCTTFNLI